MGELHKYSEIIAQIKWPFKLIIYIRLDALKVEMTLLLLVLNGEAQTLPGNKIQG